MADGQVGLEHLGADTVSCSHDPRRRKLGLGGHYILGATASQSQGFSTWMQELKIWLLSLPKLYFNICKDEDWTPEQQCSLIIPCLPGVTSERSIKITFISSVFKFTNMQFQVWWDLIWIQKHTKVYKAGSYTKRDGKGLYLSQEPYILPVI